LQQKVQHDASTIDNYIEQRVVILQNCAKILDKAIALDKDTMTQIAAYRGGANPNNDAARNDIASKVDNVANKINIAVENYPNLQAHSELADAMQQNSYLQKEITAAREVYNDTVGQWNRDIFQWPTKMIVAARAGYTSRIPFTTSNEMKEKARGTFF
jgi:LemA protein